MPLLPINDQEPCPLSIPDEPFPLRPMKPRLFAVHYKGCPRSTLPFLLLPHRLLLLGTFQQLALDRAKMLGKMALILAMPMV